ncbi:MAG: hypothetical protein GY794_18845, partial [bacterium]|nr:hypothetical protein [bacterium]
MTTMLITTMKLSKLIPSAVLGAAIMLGGCQELRWGASLPERRPLGAEFEVYKPSNIETASLFHKPAVKSKVDLTEPAGELTLRIALSLALGKSPDLESF